MKVALLCPGQASQYVGMGADLRRLSPRAAALFASAERRLGLPLAEVCERGPEERLMATEFAQPAVVATSLAAWTVLQEAFAAAGLAPAPAFAAGHSVGELAALAVAGALTADDALDLVATRARAMAAACARVDGTMAAVIGLDPDRLVAICEQASAETGASVQVANLNAPDQTVISGERGAVARAGELARAAGARRVLPLKVGGPFHSVYMQPAIAPFGEHAERVAFRTPACPVVQNVTARPVTDPVALRRNLVAQLAAPVRWVETLQFLAAAGCDRFLEVGPGQVLSGLVRRTLPGATTLNVQDEASLQATVAALRSGAA